MNIVPGTDNVLPRYPAIPGAGIDFASYLPRRGPTAVRISNKRVTWQ